MGIQQQGANGNQKFSGQCSKYSKSILNSLTAATLFNFSQWLTISPGLGTGEYFQQDTDMSSSLQQGFDRELESLERSIHHRP